MQFIARIDISDANTATEETLRLLRTDAKVRVLCVIKHESRPIQKLILVHRQCKPEPATDIKLLTGLQPPLYSGESCQNSYYIGNNIWGKNFERRSIYCQSCGYAMQGPQIRHVVIMPSDDSDWIKRIVNECEMGVCIYDEENVGMTHKIYDFLTPQHKERHDVT